MKYLFLVLMCSCASVGGQIAVKALDGVGSIAVIAVQFPHRLHEAQAEAEREERYRQIMIAVHEWIESKPSEYDVVIKRLHE